MVSRSLPTSSSNSAALIGSSPEVGSSRKTISGSSARARASAARLTMPPDSSDGNFVRGIARQADQLDLELREFVHQRARQIEIFAHRHLHVFLHRERRKQRAMLEQHAEAHVEPHPFGLARLVEVDAEQLDRAGLLAVEAEDGPQQHRLAGARTRRRSPGSRRASTSSESLSSTFLPPNATVTSRTESTTSSVAPATAPLPARFSGDGRSRHQKSIAA